MAATYAFAPPFPGDETFARSVKTPVFRVEYGDDIVPHTALRGLPLPLMAALKASPLGSVLENISTTIGYSPVGALTYGASGQTLRVDLSREEERKLLAQRLPRLATAGKNLFKRHFPANYAGMLA